MRWAWYRVLQDRGSAPLGARHGTVIVLVYHHEINDAARAGRWAGPEASVSHVLCLACLHRGRVEASAGVRGGASQA